MTKKINEHYFHKRKRTEEEKRAMYYVLGAWYGSGSSIETTRKYNPKEGNTITYTYKGIQFKNRTKKLVQIVRDELQAKSTIISDNTIRKDNPKKRNSHWFTKYGAPTLCDKLEELGVAVPEDQREFPDLPIKYLRHFVRGYSDARITLHRYNGRTQIWILGGPKFQQGTKFQQGIKEVLQKYANVGECSIKDGNFKYYGDDVKKICDFIYKEEGLYLPSKKIKFERIYKELQYVGRHIRRRINRIKKAQRVLDKGGTGDEAASAASYVYTTSLYVPFKKTTGMTVSEYRKK